MKLYYTPSACSLASNISLREAGIAFDAVKVDLRAKKTETGEDYTSINPKGYVPALRLDDGEVLTENIAVLQFIGDLNPASGLVPQAGTKERYRLQEWLAFVSTEIHKSFSPFFSPTATEDMRQHFRNLLSRRLGWLDGVLGSRQFLMGDTFTVADAYLYTVLRWSGMAGLDLGKWPAVKRYFDRIGTRPRVAEALAAEGLDQPRS